MNSSLAFIILSILAILVTLGLVLLARRGDTGNRITTLGSLAYGCILAGIIFGGANRFFGYAMLSLGIIVAVIDMFTRGRTK